MSETRPLDLTNLDEASDLFAKVFDASHEAMAITTLDDGVFVEVNQAFCDITAYSREELIGHAVGELGIWVDSGDRDELVEALKHRGYMRDLVFAFRGKDGPLPSTEFTVQLIELNGRACILTTARNLSERVQQEERTRRAAVRAEAIAEVSHALAEATRDERRVLDLVVRRASELVGDGCGILLSRADSPKLELAAAYDPDPGRERAFREMIDNSMPITADGGILGRLFETGEVLTFEGLDTPGLRPEYRASMERFDFHTAILVPLRADGRVIGAIGMARNGRGRPYTEEDQTLLKQLAAHASVAIENARLMDELRRSDEERKGLLRRLVAAQEEERRRIAADLHDDSVQAMVAVDLRLATLRRELAGSEGAAKLRSLMKTVELAVARLRRLMFELRPPALDRDGLVAAIREYIDQTEDDGVEYKLASRLTEDVPEEARVAIYRITQEALANVRRHARATAVSIVLEPKGDGVYVRITDDGAGFPAGKDEAPHPGHLGFVAMRERAESVGGWWQISSVPGTGTTVEFWIPTAGRPPVT